MGERSSLGIEGRIRAQASERKMRFTLHAHQEMLEEDITPEELVACLEKCKLLEYYPHHKRGPCCLLFGPGNAGRMLHVVCTYGHAELIIITVYEPKPPKWETAYKRGTRS